MDGLSRVVWAAAVVGGGLALARGLLLTTYFELTPQEQAEAERGRLWLWAGAVVLVVAAVLAARAWSVSLGWLVALGAAGPVALVVEGLGWIPLVALLLVVPLVLLGLTGVLLAPRRVPPEGADDGGAPLRS